MPVAMAITFFKAPPEFAAHHVVIRIDAEQARVEDRLQLTSHFGVLERDDAGRRETGHDLLREVRPRECTRRVIGQHLPDDFGHAQMAAGLETPSRGSRPAPTAGSSERPRPACRACYARAHPSPPRPRRGPLPRGNPSPRDARRACSRVDRSSWCGARFTSSATLGGGGTTASWARVVAGDVGRWWVPNEPAPRTATRSGMGDS